MCKRKLTFHEIFSARIFEASVRARSATPSASMRLFSALS